MERYKILVVDDESRMRKLVSDFLVKSQYQVVEAENGREALDVFFAHKDIALVALDVMMPKMDGWQVCREIRAYSQVPIIMLTARGDEKDELQGFRLGVDEYITKPFSPKILVARIEAILRRSGQKGVSGGEVLDCGGIQLDKAAHQVMIDGEPVELSYKEFELLAYMAYHKNLVLTRAQLLAAVWEMDYTGDIRTVDTHIKCLRQKIGEYAHCIVTVRGVGYMFQWDEGLIG